MSDETKDKHRKPDYYIQLEIRGAGGKKRLTDVGGVWEGKNGYKTGNSIWGRMVVQPGDKREAELHKLRTEKAEQRERGPAPDQEPKL